MARVCIYPGSFDPPTVGHLDVIRRARSLYDQVVVAVLINGAKQGAFAPEERRHMLEKCLSGMDGVSVVTDSGLLVDVARRVGAGVILRGIRTEADVALESQLAAANRHLSGIETVCLFTSPEAGYISSTIVRDVARHDGCLDGLAPPEIMADIRNKLGTKKHRA